MTAGGIFPGEAGDVFATDAEEVDGGRSHILQGENQNSPHRVATWIGSRVYGWLTCGIDVVIDCEKNLGYLRPFEAGAADLVLAEGAAAAIRPRALVYPGREIASTSGLINVWPRRRQRSAER